jgi:rubredoxin
MRGKEKEKSKEKEEIKFKRRVRPASAASALHLKGITVDKYKCTVCGYIYDPAQGDSTQGIKPGMPFSALPDSWACPDCGVGKDMFEKV